MNETTQMILFMLTGVFICVAAGTTAYINLNNKFSGMQLELAVFKVKFDNLISILGSRGVSALHSPDNHLRVDEIVEEYERNNFDVPLAKWIRLKEAAEIVLSDPNEKDVEKNYYVKLGLLLSKHKLENIPNISFKI